MNNDTIVAQATASGRASVGIIRVSGPNVINVIKHIVGITLIPRQATLVNFKSLNNESLDQGLAIFFNAPNSFTGEDVLELQGHGGQMVLNIILKEILTIPNIRIAKPGEFSERAFLNDKLDLAQAEAISDLIDASSEQAAKSAMQTLSGTFSNLINNLVERTIYLRTYIEAAIDFPDEEIDFLADGVIESKLKQLIDDVININNQAKQGAIIREGMHVVLAGKPNAGKSSLLNLLTGDDTAIVTEIPGTTRDTISSHINIDGMPLHITDTAGLRETDDPIEKIGIERTWNAIEKADQILLLVDSTFELENDPLLISPQFMKKIPQNIGVTLIKNKADLITGPFKNSDNVLYISAKTGFGTMELKDHLKQLMGYKDNQQSAFIARQRHVKAITDAKEHLLLGYEQLTKHKAGELLAEELRLTTQALSEITGKFTADDLLTKIFSSFCLGK